MLQLGIWAGNQDRNFWKGPRLVVFIQAAPIFAPVVFKKRGVRGFSIPGVNIKDEPSASVDLGFPPPPNHCSEGQLYIYTCYIVTTKRFFTRQCFLESRPGGNNNGRGPCGVWRLQRTSSQEHAKIQRRALGSFNVSTPADKDAPVSTVVFLSGLHGCMKGHLSSPPLPRFERHSRS